MKKISYFLFSYLVFNFSFSSKQQIHVPGVAIDFSAPQSQVFIGSPSIAILPGSDYVALHDFFSLNSTTTLTQLFRSTDRRLTWQK